MKTDDEIPADLNQRIDELTRHSIEWKENWVAGVKAGLEDAEGGVFASDDEVAAVLNRYKDRLTQI